MWAVPPKGELTVGVDRLRYSSRRRSAGRPPNRLSTVQRAKSTGRPENRWSDDHDGLARAPVGPGRSSSSARSSSGGRCRVGTTGRPEGAWSANRPSTSADGDGPTPADRTVNASTPPIVPTADSGGAPPASRASTSRTAVGSEARKRCGRCGSSSGLRRQGVHPSGREPDECTSGTRYRLGEFDRLRQSADFVGREGPVMSSVTRPGD